MLALEHCAKVTGRLDVTSLSTLLSNTYKQIKQFACSVVFLCCLFLVSRVSVTFHLMCVYIIFVWFRLLSDHHLGKSCSLGWPFVLIVNWLFVTLVIFRFGFEGWIWVLTAWCYFNMYQNNNCPFTNIYLKEKIRCSFLLSYKPRSMHYSTEPNNA